MEFDCWELECFVATSLSLYQWASRHLTCTCPSLIRKCTTAFTMAWVGVSRVSAELRRGWQNRRHDHSVDFAGIPSYRQYPSSSSTIFCLTLGWLVARILAELVSSSFEHLSARIRRQRAINSRLENRMDAQDIMILVISTITVVCTLIRWHQGSPSTSTLVRYLRVVWCSRNPKFPGQS